jgi:heme-degrading monooxygenase HmoA
VFARISTFKRSLENLDEGIVLLRESMLPRLQKQPGFDGVLVMADRANGVAYAITFWKSEEDLAASKESGKQFAETAAQLYDLQVEVGNCEVAFSTPLTLGA